MKFKTKEELETYLKCYSTITKQINDKQDSILFYRTQLDKITGKGSEIQTNDNDIKSQRYLAIALDLENEIEELFNKRNKLEADMIDMFLNLNNELHNNILVARHISLYSWKEIGISLNYTKSGARKAYKKAFNHLFEREHPRTP